MRTISRISLIASAAASIALYASSAAAFDSTRGPLYIEGSPLGVGTVDLASVCVDVDGADFCGGGGVGVAYRISAEVGYHFSGRHDRFVLGGRQVFLFGGTSAGITEVRLGWDIPIPVRQFEITIAPYGVAGIAYGFGVGGAFAFGIGVEGRFFWSQHAFAYLQPVEIGSWIGSKYSGVTDQSSVGVGYAF